jgi:outer membrane protein TolC
MTNRIHLISLLLLIAVSGYAQQEDSLNVDQAIRLTLETSQALRSVDAMVLGSRARVRQAESMFLPQVGALADYTRVGPIAEFAIPGLGALPLNPPNNVDAHVSAAYVIYDFGRRNSILAAANSGIAVSEDSRAVLRSALTQQAIRAFFSVMFLQRSVDVQVQQIESLTRHLEDTRRRVESGSATEFDELSTSVRVAQAQNQRIDLEKSLHDEETTIRKLTGAAWDAAINPSGDFRIGVLSAGVDSLLGIARQARPDLLAARNLLEQARVTRSAIATGNAPKVLVHAGYGLKNGYEPNIDAIRGNWSVGGTIEVPIFEGGITSARVEEADAGILASELRYKDLERSAEAEVRQALFGVRSAEAKISATTLQVSQAERAVENARVRYQSGAGTNLDVLDAETNVASSRLQQLQALFQSVLAQSSLKASVGLYAR